jgi:hypothetical protein
MNAGSQHLPIYTTTLPGLGGKPPLTFNFVGTDPALGAATTTIPTIIVPLKFVFPNPGNPTLDGTNIVPVVINSPIFQPTSFTAGSVNLGVTQYGDAVLRAQSWNAPGFSQNYHVLLGTPSVAPTITITVPQGVGNAALLANGAYIGTVDFMFFAETLFGLSQSYSADQLPIFVSDNVFPGTPTAVEASGFHDSEAEWGIPSTSARTWIFIGNPDFGTSAPPPFQVSSYVLSHEVAEWLNDPFGMNFIPPADLSYICQPLLEVGDPLSGAAFSKTINASTYLLQDVVFRQWYLPDAPTYSVNGWRTFQNLGGTLPLIVNSPANIKGVFTDTAQPTWAPFNAPVSGDIVYLGQGCPAGSINGTNPDDPYLGNPAGKIAFLDRGACALSLKVERATKAGAIAVVVGQVTPGPATAPGYGGGSIVGPTLIISQPESDKIKSVLGTSTVNVSIDPSQRIPFPARTLCPAG